MATSKRKDYKTPVIYWCFSVAAKNIRQISVVAESDCSLWIKPDRETDDRGRPFPPILRHKRSLPTFHSYQEAKNELDRQLVKNG